jgi:hypothetical protein
MMVLCAGPQAMGVRLPTDIEAGWQEYGHRRHLWELELAAFALYLGYDWEEVTGDGDLSCPE